MSAAQPAQQQAPPAAAAAAAAPAPAVVAAAVGQPAEERPPGKCHYYMEKVRAARGWTRLLHSLQACAVGVRSSSTSALSAEAAPLQV